MRYQQTAIHIHAAPEDTRDVTFKELESLVISVLGFVVFFAIFAFVAFGDGLGGR